MSKKSTILFTATILILLSIVLNTVIAESGIGLKINMTDSLPYRLFLSRKAYSQGLKHGTIISFSNVQLEIPLAKQIAGLPGDNIRVMADHVYINDVCFGKIHTESPCGMKLTPIQEGEIPHGFVFVCGQHEQSYDSRYAEFGLVKMEKIQDVLWPLF